MLRIVSADFSKTETFNNISEIRNLLADLDTSVVAEGGVHGLSLCATRYCLIKPREPQQLPLGHPGKLCKIS